mgnify:CR=1 FL=1
MTAGTTNFPGSLDSHTGASPLGFGEATNQANTLTTASHTNSVTTITVVSTAKFPSKGYIVVKREIISYTGTTATTFTGCTRGVGGTTADAYLTGTKVEHVVVAENHNDLAAGLVAVETQMGAKLAYMPRKNRVINGDMRVCQRTTLGSSDDTFTLDRWTVLMEAANGCVVTQETSDVPTDGSKYAAKLTVGSGEDNKFGLATYLEFRDIADLRGKTISLQARLEWLEEVRGLDLLLRGPRPAPGLAGLAARLAPQPEDRQAKLRAGVAAWPQTWKSAGQGHPAGNQFFRGRTRASRRCFSALSARVVARARRW